MKQSKTSTPPLHSTPGLDAAGQLRRRLLRAAAATPALALAALAQGCSLPVPGQGPPPELFRLTPKSSFDEDLPAVDWQLVLEPPVADAGLNTTRIALQRAPTQIEYYARSGWADRAPLMIQTLMVESFENSQKIVSIGRESIGLRADFILKSELRELQAVYFNGGLPEAWVSINAKLVQMPRRAIVASQSFDHRVTAAADSLPEIIAAFDEAAGKVLRRLVAWTLIEGDRADRAMRRTS
jgi:cholesterol transport system auxiliary component